MGCGRVRMVWSGSRGGSGGVEKSEATGFHLIYYIYIYIYILVAFPLRRART